MKNLKKVLALVTVVAMLLTCAPVVLAGTYSDVSDNASYAEAVEMLSALGIFTGYEDGTFQPDKTITRAEAAAVITRFLGQEDTAKAMAGETVFNDMGGAEWATGYVNFGVQKGYINGMGDGTFHPSDPVTYEQIVKMIVAALGYEIKAQDQGGYPSGYLAVASQLEITKGTSGSNGAASRATVAKLLYQALDAKKMVVTSYKSNGEKEYGEGKTPLKEDHDVDKYVAVVSNTSMIDLDSAEDDKTVDLDYTEKNGEKEEGTENGVMVGKSDALSYLGYTVTAYVQEDEETGDPTIIAIAAKGSKNSVLTVPAANMESIDDETASYWKNKDSDKKATEIDLNDPTVIINNEKSTVANIDLDEINGVVTFISNDGNTNNGYEFIIVSSYDEEFVIDEIDTDNFRVEAVNGSTSGLNINSPYEFDPEDEDVLSTIIKDGKVASFEDLEEGDTVSVIGADTNNRVFYVSSAKAEGAVTRKSSGNPVKYTIDGSQYEAKDGVLIDVADEGTFYINVDGIIIYADATADATGNYGYFIAADSKISFGKTAWTVEFVDENGNDVTAKLAARVKVGEGKVGSVSVKSEELDLDDILDAPQLFKYDTNSAGDITKIITAKDRKTDKEFSKAGESYGEDETTYSAKTNRAGRYEFDDDTVVFNVKDPVEDADDVTVSTIKALFQDGEYAPAFDAYDMKSDSKVVGAVVTHGAAGNIDEAANVVIVTSVSSTKFGDETGYVIEGVQGGKSVSFNVCDEEEALKAGSEDPANLEKGDVIMVAEGAEYLTNIVLKACPFDLDNPYDTDFVPVSQKRTARDTFGKVTARDSNDITIEGFSYDTKIDDFNVSGARFTLVGLTGANTTVKNSSVGAINPTNSKGYEYYVYVRYYDDDCIDVVIFETKADDQ
jgi:hypothetical protein